MCKRKIAELKRCVICQKLLRGNNQTGLCAYHYKDYWEHWKTKGMSAWLEKIKKEKKL